MDKKIIWEPYVHFVDGMDKTTDFDRHFYLNALLTSSYPQGVFLHWARVNTARKADMNLLYKYFIKSRNKRNEI